MLMLRRRVIELDLNGLVPRSCWWVVLGGSEVERKFKVEVWNFCDAHFAFHFESSKP